jgi:RNA polymerase sigma-70 factor, ECF subfamily
MPEHRIAASAPAEPAPVAEPTLRLPGPLVDLLFGEAAVPAEWRLSRERFARALERSAAQRFRGGAANAGGVAAYLESLHLSDLALACACSEGDESAWEHFVREYRSELYRAARAIAGESQGRELADSLYAELYGLEERGGQRRSLFDYFHGRSKLSTWLRAVLAQRHVDELRRAKNAEPLDETKDCEPPAGANAKRDPAPDPERERYLALMQAALSETLAALELRDRLHLTYYYIEDLTLAQIGRLTGEHEATVSRKLDRTRRAVREQVDAALREKKQLSEAQLRLCYEYAREEWPFDLTKALSARE